VAEEEDPGLRRTTNSLLFPYICDSRAEGVLTESQIAECEMDLATLTVFRKIFSGVAGATSTGETGRRNRSRTTGLNLPGPGRDNLP
jgi:hypothetical protein